MSKPDNNGLSADDDLDAAAEWDRRAAEAGAPVGKFNFGISLLRGPGVAQDMATGRTLVDAAAADGLHEARRLQASGYDLEKIAPDADNPRFAPLF